MEVLGYSRTRQLRSLKNTIGTNMLRSLVLEIKYFVNSITNGITPIGSDIVKTLGNKT
jgi:hypothetical protein